MFILVQSNDYENYSSLIDSYFKLRKKVFYETLNWNVPIKEEHERDHYDDLNPVYLLWCDKWHRNLYGGMRLMPTTGPTLLYDTFRSTFPDAANLISPFIWEGTRMCINEELVRSEYPDLSAGRAFSLLFLALCETALAHGIESLVCNYEPHMKRVYQRAGVSVDELGRASHYGKYPVCCGLFEVSENVLASMRTKLKINSSLLTENA